MKRPSFQASFLAAYLILASQCALSQGEAAVPFLLLPASPETFGMGGTSSAFESDHPLTAVGNPAQLGLFSRRNFLNMGIHLPASQPFPSWGLPDQSYSVFGINAGANLDDLAGIPISVGLGYSRTSMDWGTFQITNSSGPEVIATFHSHESSDDISLGVGLDYWVRFGAGVSMKFINSHLSPLGTEQEMGDASASVTAYDIGFLLTIPVVEIAGRAGGDLTIPSAHLAPLLDVTFGYAKNNIGDEVVYIDPAQADPLPRQASLAAGVEAGIVSTVVPEGWRLLTGSLLREANDILVERHSDGTWDYVGGAGEISFVDDVVLGKSNSAITQRKGWKVEMGEVVSLRGGSVSGPTSLYYGGYTTNGFGIRLSGIWKALFAMGAEEGNPWLTFIRENIDLRYDYAKLLYSGEMEGSTFGSLSLIVKKMPF